MREIVLDTETTGLDPSSGDRIVEIGAIELFNHMPTGQVFHRYLNPDKKIKIKEPNKGKVVTNSEFNKIQGDKMNEMRER